MSAPTVGDQKQALRRQIRAAARQFSAESARTASQSIRHHLEKWIGDTTRKESRTLTIALFAALPGEPDLLPLISKFSSFRWGLPRVSGELLKWHSVKTIESLIPGAFGICEPDPATCEEIEGGAIDAFLVPGMAFDLRTGNRLGRGKGYYDRALVAAGGTSIAIGVGFEWQILPGIPAESHDRSMNAIVSESGLCWIAKNDPLNS
jgi:5-formyltetrahydrofolate cyclo-ligase